MRPPLQKYKSLSGECRRGRTLAGPSRSFCHSGATLIRLASLGTFPLEGGRLAGGHMGPPLRRIWKRFLLFRRGRTLAGPPVNGLLSELRRRGHTPGWLLSAFGRFTFSPSPTVLKKTFRNWVGEALGPPVRIRTGSVGSAYSGAVRKLHQQQIWTTQAPSGAGRKRRQVLLILRAGTMAAQTRRASPVKRGPGKAVLWT